MTVIVDGAETVLGPLDSCTIAPGEVREIVNRANHVCNDAGRHPLSAGSAAMSDFLRTRSRSSTSQGKVAIVTGASGAFGALAAQGAGGRGRQARARRRQARTRWTRRRATAASWAPKSMAINARARPTRPPATPSSPQAVRALRPRRHPRRRLGQERRRQDHRHGAGALPRRDGRQRHPVLADGARRDQRRCWSRARAARSC